MTTNGREGHQGMNPGGRGQEVIPFPMSHMYIISKIPPGICRISFVTLLPYM